MAELHRLEVPITPYARPFGIDGGTVYMQHNAGGQPILFEGVDTLVLCHGHQPETELEAELKDLGIRPHLLGDCLAPRTAEEAVFEGLKVGWAI